MKNYYSKKENNYKEFQTMLANKLLEAELKLLEREKEAILKDVITADDRMNIDTQLFKIELEIRQKKEAYARNILIIHQQDNDLYNSKNIYNDF